MIFTKKWREALDMNERQNCGMNHNLQEQVTAVNSSHLLNLIEKNRAFSGSSQSRHQQLLEKMCAAKQQENSSRMVLAA